MSNASISARCSLDSSPSGSPAATISWKPRPTTSSKRPSRSPRRTAPWTLSVPASGSEPPSPDALRRHAAGRARAAEAARPGAAVASRSAAAFGSSWHSTFPSSMARRITASFWGWRSASIVSSSRVGMPGRAARDRASRPGSRRRADPSTAPDPGTAGSGEPHRPTSSSVPAAHLVGQHRAELVDRAAGQRPVLAAGTTARAATTPGPDPRNPTACSSGSSMNSHRRCRGPLCTIVVGRAGSHHWLAIGRWASASMSCGSASTTSQRSWKPRSRRVIPLASRTNELAPSAPTSHRALTVRVSPVSASLPALVLARPAEASARRRSSRLNEPLGRPSALDGHARPGARVAVDRPLELRLEEHVVRLPSRRRRAARLEAQEQLAVGAEPAGSRAPGPSPRPAPRRARATAADA